MHGAHVSSRSARGGAEQRSPRGGAACGIESLDGRIIVPTGSARARLRTPQD